jgi:hypothetical protein
MAGRRPQPVTEATNPAPQTPVEMPTLMSSAVMPQPPAPPQPQSMAMQPPQMGGGAMTRPMPSNAMMADWGNGAPPPPLGDGSGVMSTGMPMMRPMPNQKYMSQAPQGPAYGGPRTTNGKNGGYRPQSYGPFGGGGGFGGGCGH